MSHSSMPNSSRHAALLKNPLCRTAGFIVNAQLFIKQKFFGGCRGAVLQKSPPAPQGMPEAK